MATSQTAEVIVVDDVEAEHLNETTVEQMARFGYMFSTARVMTTPDEIEVEPLPRPERKKPIARTPSAAMPGTGETG
jgi:hypothetical protein